MSRVALLACALFVAFAALGNAFTPVADQITIPARSVLYKLKLEREVAAEFGDLRPAARIAAQVHQESRWNPNAASRYAQGMTQFTPATAQWIGSVCPSLGPADVWDPNWAMRAAVCYDRWLYLRLADAATECDRWAMVLAGYNGGPGWVTRDRRRAAAAGSDPAVWFDHVELHSSRASWAFRENRDYVRRILMLGEPAYLAAGWPGEAVCGA